eukprot:2266878-Pyramimonas_sp.AAC.1
MGVSEVTHVVLERHRIANDFVARALDDVIAHLRGNHGVHQLVVRLHGQLCEVGLACLRILQR